MAIRGQSGRDDGAHRSSLLWRTIMFRVIPFLGLARLPSIVRRKKIDVVHFRPHIDTDLAGMR